MAHLLWVAHRAEAVRLAHVQAHILGIKFGTRFPRRKKGRTLSEQDDDVTALEPLSKRRLQGSLARNEWNYFIDDQGDIGSAWDVGRIYYMLIGDDRQILFMPGYFEGEYPAGLALDLLRFCNEWEAHNAMPKAYIQERDGKVFLRGDWMLGLKGGITDVQLDEVVRSATLSVMKFFEAAQERFGN